jgi:uncharacterized protein YdeI (YjbR/CyaY-like superfamily)
MPIRLVCPFAAVLASRAHLDMGDMNSPHFFASAALFRDWLHAHAATAPELLVGFHKVHTERPCMSWSESVDEALCVGWIDAVRRRIDDDRYSIRFTPRRPTSIWSVVNLAKVEQLRLQGRMTAAGELAFSLRRADKSAVYAYEQATHAELTADEVQRFQALPDACSYFEACPPGYRKQMLHWLSAAKRETTRAARFQTLLDACTAGLRLR